jgi:pyruvate formate lyase activating enzyme
MDIQSTPESTLKEYYKLAKAKLKYVYVGNVQIVGTEDTCCPGCGQVLIKRSGYRTSLEGLKGRDCKKCGRRADIIGLNG